MFFFEQYNNKNINPFYDIESSALKTYGCENLIDCFVFDEHDFINTSNEVFYLKYQDGSEAFLKENLSSYIKEALVYQIGSLLDLQNENGEESKLLMPTAIRSYHHNNKEIIGSVMQKAYGKVGESKNLSIFNFKNSKEMLILDAIIGNQDRHDDNIAFDISNRKIHGIDHSETFKYDIDIYGLSSHFHSCFYTCIDYSEKIPQSIKYALNKIPNKNFEDILFKALFDDKILALQNADVPNYQKPFPEGPYNTKKYMLQVINKIRQSETFGDLLS